jgi:ATPase family associated with various cellular activities (AAA)
MLQVAERQRELQHARDLVDMEQAVKQQELAAQALQLEAEAERATAADMRAAALQRIRDQCHAAQAAAAADHARHCSELEQRHGSNSNSSSGSSRSGSSNALTPGKATAASAAATTAISSSDDLRSGGSADRATKAAVASAVNSAQTSAALVDLLDALTAAGRSGDVPAMCSAITAVPAAARSSLAAALVPALGELAADLMTAADAATATATATTAAVATNKLPPSLQGALQLCATGQWVKAYTALTAAVAESSSSSAASTGTALYALALCEVHIAGGSLGASEASALLQRLYAQDTANRNSNSSSSSSAVKLDVSPLRSLAYAAVHAAAADAATAHLACAAALHFLLLPQALLEAQCGSADCWRAAATSIASRTAAALAAALDGGHMNTSSTGSASTVQDGEQQQQAVLQREWQRLKAQCAVQSDAMEALLAMSGMIPIKTRFLNVVNSVVLDKQRGFCLNERSYNVRLEGNPGTGKTTVARLYAALLRDLGVFAAATAKAQQAAANSSSSGANSSSASSSGSGNKKEPKSVQETTGADLADGGVRHLKSMLQEIEEAGGGLLFVDEAYTLSPDAIGGQGKQVLFIAFTTASTTDFTVMRITILLVRVLK